MMRSFGGPSRVDRRLFICLAVLSLVLAGCLRKPAEKEALFVKEGQEHLAAKDFGRAVIDFRNAVQSVPQDAEAHYQLGLAYMGLGDAKAAMNEFLQATHLDPKHVAAQLKLAEIMTMNQNRDLVAAGEKKAEEVLELSPGNADALQTLAVAELRLEDPKDAIQHLEEALEKDPGHLNAATTLAMAKLHGNDVTGAEQVMQKSVAEAPRSAPHALAFGRFYALIRKPDEAEKQFRRALEIDPKYGPALTALGATLDRAGKLDEAGQLFQRASSLPDKQYKPLYAIFLLQTGKNDQAIAEFTRQYAADVQDRDARTRLISAYLRLGKTADAQKILGEALRKNGADADARMQRGALYLAAGKLDEAQVDITGALRFRADSPQAHFLMAHLHGARNESASQIQELTEVLRLNPKLLAARLELAHAYTVGKTPKSALDLLAQAPPERQPNLALIVERNTALYALGDYAELRKGIDQGLAISRHATLLMQDGVLKLKQQNYAAGRASLKEALKLQPENWKALETIAVSYVAEGKMAEAIAVVREYTSRAPDSAAAQQVLGSWLLTTKDLPGALLAFQRAKSLAPTATAADFGMAQVAIAEGKLQAAHDTLIGILNREPRNLDALMSLGGVDERAGRPSDAIALYERAVQSDPNNVQGLNNLAYLLADTGRDPDRALALAQKVKELVPNSPAVDDTIGWAYYNKGLFKASLDYLGKAANNGTPLRKSHLAMAYIKVGDPQRALPLLQAALRDDPSLPEAQRAMQLLAQSR